MSTANERAGIMSDLLLVNGDVSEANEPDTSGKSALYYIIGIGSVFIFAMSKQVYGKMNILRLD